MSDRRFTLIDVMLGIDKHGLVCKLSEQSFTFLIGIILEHNRRGFRMPFDLNNLQAMAAGGGNTPKSVRRRRSTLCEFRIDGKPVLKVTSGNFGRNTCAKYEISYESLLLYNGVWTGENGLPVLNPPKYGSVPGTVVGTVPGPILRSDQRRLDNTYPTDSNIVTTEEGGETRVDVSEKGKVGDLENEEDPQDGKLSYVIHQIQILFCHGAPIELNSPQYEKAMQISEFDRREIEEALEACEKAKYDLNPTKRPRNSGWILNRLMHPEWFSRGSVVGRRTKGIVLRELKDYKRYLAEVVPMAEANPKEQYLKDMIAESKKMIEKLEAEHGRYKGSDGGGGEKSGDG